VRDLAFVKTTLLEIDATASTIGEIDVNRMFAEIVGSSPALQVVWSRVRKQCRQTGRLLLPEKPVR